MPINSTAVIIMAFSAIPGPALLLLLWRNQTRRRAALHAMAQRRGWQIDINLSRFGAPERTRLVPLPGSAAAPWQLALRRQHNNGEGISEIASADYTRPEPRWPDGLLVLGPPLPPEAAAMAGMMLGMMQGPLGEALLGKLVGPGLAAQATGLRPLAPVAGATAFASRDPAGRADPAQIAALLSEWQSLKSGETGRPILILGPDGMRLRLRHLLKKPEEIEAFIDLGARLADALRA